MDSTTITISGRTRRELLRVAGELQLKRGKRVDYEDVIEYLLAKSMKDERLLMQAVKPTGRSSAELQEALRQGRSEDRRGEEELERRYS
ncbi:MAG: hypothetical protein ABSG45_00905 [Nitrososphaerales archaeon]